MAQKNIFGEDLINCSTKPLTGYFRDGCCNTDKSDLGSHTVCVIVNEAFLNFSKETGNDLSTPRPEWNFAGLKPGDRWCLCAARFKDAAMFGFAPKVVMEATHERCLDIVDMDILIKHAYKNDGNH